MPPTISPETQDSSRDQRDGGAGSGHRRSLRMAAIPPAVADGFADQTSRHSRNKFTAVRRVRRTGADGCRSTRHGVLAHLLGRAICVLTVSADPTVGPWLLYDNLEDPFQMVNRCGDPAYADEQSRLDTELMSWLDTLGDEFLPGDVYLRRDGLEHYLEVNEPLGSSGTGQWRSTNERGRYFTIDTALSEIAAHDAARDIVLSLAPSLMEFDTPLAVRRSIRILAMTERRPVPPARLKDLDDRLLSLGPRSQSPRSSVALPAWPPSERLTPLGDLWTRSSL